MAVISVNVAGRDWDSATPLAPALEALPPCGAVTVMIHGYRYSPRDPANDPHRHILSPRGGSTRWKSVSWPQHLHLNRPGAGLGIALGWHARGSLVRVAARAFEIGDTLAEIIIRIKAQRPDLHVNILGHSLGARVALSALAALPAGHVDRLILLSGAEYRGLASAAMASPAGRGAQVLNVTSGENAPFDALFRLAVPAPPLTDWPLAAGLPACPGWTDLRVDCPAARATLRGLGYPTRAPATRICHWSTYLRPGLFRLYRDICDPARPDPLPRLAAALRPASSLPRGEARRLSPPLTPL